MLYIKVGAGRVADFCFDKYNRSDIVVSVKKRAKNFQVLCGFIPTAFAIWFVFSPKAWLLILTIVSLFVVVGKVPLFKKRENLWMFLFVVSASLPINVFIAYSLIKSEFISTGVLFGDLLWGVLICCMLVSVEEIAFGIVTRAIWKRQYKLNL